MVNIIRRNILSTWLSGQVFRKPFLLNTCQLPNIRLIVSSTFACIPNPFESRKKKVKVNQERAWRYYWTIHIPSFCQPCSHWAWDAGANAKCFVKTAHSALIPNLYLSTNVIMHVTHKRVHVPRIFFEGSLIKLSLLIGIVSVLHLHCMWYTSFYWNKNWSQNIR